MPDGGSHNGINTVSVADGAPAAAALPFVTLGHLLRPKVLTVRSRISSTERGSTARTVILAVAALLFWAAIFEVLSRILTYFRDVQDIGALLAGKLMGLILIGFFAILLLSNVIGALSTFFMARDLDMIVSAPLDWFRVYVAKLIETAVHSSWMVLLISVPIFSAYGASYDGGWLFPVVAIAVLIPFLVLPATVGSAITLLLVNVFPARRTRDILTVLAVLSAAGLVLLFRMVRPERLAKPEAYESLTEFVAVLRAPTSPFLPSEWAQNVIMSYLTGVDRNSAFLFFLLWLTAASFVILGAKAHGMLYHKGYTKAQEGTGVARGARKGALERFAERLFRVVGTTKRELLMKEIRIFFRDSTQWSQLILLAVLVVVYVVNITYQGERKLFLPFRMVSDLELAPMNPGLGQYFGVTTGVLVINVPERTTLNLRSGDVVTLVDGRRVSNPSQFFRVLFSYEPGEQFRFEIVRMKRRETVTGSLAER
jgi:ABC-2 type transport system permease protein